MDRCCCCDDGVRGVLYIGLVIPPCGKPPGVVELADGVKGLLCIGLEAEWSECIDCGETSGVCCLIGLLTVPDEAMGLARGIPTPGIGLCMAEGLILGGPIGLPIGLCCMLFMFPLKCGGIGWPPLLSVGGNIRLDC